MKLVPDKCRFLICVLTFGAWCGVALSAPAPDHPLVGSYEGSEQVGRRISEFDEVEIMNGPIGNSRGIGAPGWLRLEGKISLLYYKLPAERSTLEVLRNYQTSLEGKGFRTLFTCATSNGSCYIGREGRSVETAPYSFALALDANPELPRLDGDYIRNYFETNARYLLAKLDRPEGAVYVSISFSEHRRGNYAFMRVIETKEMDSGKIGFIGADVMQKSIADSGRVNLYGIHFDFDKDTLRPESKPTLDEIGKLMRAEAELKLIIVGHTDAKGSADYNLDLSKRRAARVRMALTHDYGIDTTRLQARGAGSTEPMSSNDDEEGRAKNRRVELVKS